MPDLVIHGLEKSFGSLKALSNVSFQVKAGEIFGFVGSNGAGKTTAMRIILGVLAADTGEVTFDGKPLDLKTRRRVGYMPEERGLYPKMKVGEQLIYLAQLHGEDKSSATKSMEYWTERLGVDSRRDEEVQKLSLGNQQRVQLAAALVHNPDVLVLDEPFSGLDPIAVNVMSDVLKERAAEGVPVIFSSHQLDLVERLCDRVGIIREGQMVACDTIPNLRQHDQQVVDIRLLNALPDWTQHLPATITVIEPGGNTARVSLPSHDQELRAQLLAAATQAGALQEISNYYPPLTELYREAISTPHGGHHA
ncbi:ABC transporter ATP-binding protein [Corynebacterium spheniscorum]|uniref:ABC-2 type transport system ATP-binding protein n=1 Tax=Corynebacterium spheniscorum TaxID=185761 RepID=A0A1I2RQW2_9CORY|nr:ATP-binding cassette domain-containing protein [Corynebacterium spheniscorum]KAA8724043.1 ATP-binding cassette domain-containing protein [Corynebacterium spheniscorum]SFG42483.1 ABC-2 type transport system ATP-binding protein [Corynebacterium spheniscorum]